MGAKLIKFSVQPFSKARVIGKGVTQKLDVGLEDRTIQDLWEQMERDGSLEFLAALPKITPPKDTVGWMGDFQPGDDQYTYLAGILAAADTPAPEGYIYRDVVDCEMAIGWIQATPDAEGGDLMANASDHVTKGMAENRYEYDASKGMFEIEYYSYERFRMPMQRGEPPILEFYSPCKRVAENCS